MWKWILKILGVADLQFKMELVNRDLNKAFNRIERIEKTTRIGRRSMRYDEINRARKRRYKNWPKKGS